MEAVRALPEDEPMGHPEVRAKNTPIDTLVALKAKYPTISQKNLGKLVGISGAAVSMMFMRHGIDWETGQILALEEFKSHRADIYAIKQIECLNAMSGKKLKAATAQQLAYVKGVLFDKEMRLREAAGGDRDNGFLGLMAKITVNPGASGETVVEVKALGGHGPGLKTDLPAED